MIKEQRGANEARIIRRQQTLTTLLWLNMDMYLCLLKMGL